MMRDEDVEKLLIMVNPETWDPTFNKGTKNSTSPFLPSSSSSSSAHYSPLLDIGLSNFSPSCSILDYFIPWMS
jgi:hypothetical protein